MASKYAGFRACGRERSQVQGEAEGQDHIKLAVSDWKVWQPLLSTPDSSSIPTKHSILCLEYIWREYQKKQ